MFWNPYILREESANKRIIIECKNEYGITNFDKRKDIVQKIINNGTDSIKNVFGKAISKYDDAGKELEELCANIEQYVLNSDQYYFDIMSDVLLGILFFDENCDIPVADRLAESWTLKCNERNVTCNRKKLSKEDWKYKLNAAWVQKSKNKAIKMSVIHKRYPLRADMYEDAFELETSEDVDEDEVPRKYIYTIYDGCAGYHEIMITKHLNLYMKADADEDMRRQKTCDRYSMRSIMSVATEMRTMYSQNQCLFEKSIGFIYSCIVFKYLKEIDDVDELLSYGQIVDNSLSLAACGLRTDVMSFLLSFIHSGNEQQCGYRRDIISEISGILFKLLDDIYREILRIYSAVYFEQYMKMNFEEKDEWVRSIQNILQDEMDKRWVNAKNAYDDILKSEHILCIPTEVEGDCYDEFQNPLEDPGLKLISGQLEIPEVYCNDVKEACHLGIKKPMNEFEEIVFDRTKTILMGRKYDTVSDAKKEYYSILRKEYTELRKETENRIQNTDLKYPKSKTTYAHVFAWIQEKVINGLLDLE